MIVPAHSPSGSEQDYPAVYLCIILNGVTPTTDPLTGETRKVWTGTQDNYWVNGVGQVVNSHDAPAAGWHPLQTN
jgi:hypothetical protein